jgi:hypothetical protein
MLKELSTTMATDLGDPKPIVEKEKTAGFENTRTRSTRIRDLRIRKSKSFILDLLAISP